MPEVQKNPMRLISGLLALLLLSLHSVPLTQAGEAVFVRESLRARGMGYAHTAVANDEYLLFYNPAGLRSLQNNIYEALLNHGGIRDLNRSSVILRSGFVV